MFKKNLKLLLILNTFYEIQDVTNFLWRFYFYIFYLTFLSDKQSLNIMWWFNSIERLIVSGRTIGTVENSELINYQVMNEPRTTRLVNDSLKVARTYRLGA